MSATSPKTEPNINAGIKYMRYMIDHFYERRADDQAGQGAVRLRLVQRRAGAGGAVAQGGGESAASTRTSGSTTSSTSPPTRSARRPSPTSANIYKYYIGYRLVLENQAAKKADLEKIRAGPR